LWTKRLFGFRGGRAAFEAERRNDSLLELEHAATEGVQAPVTVGHASSHDMTMSERLR
jgi:hypothetical protein